MHYSQFTHELVEVSLKNKPARLLDISPKGTVPVLQLADGTVIDESIDIIRHALNTSDPEQWLPQNEQEKQEMQALIQGNDGPFKKQLDRYKYHTRHPEATQEALRQEGELWITGLESRLAQSPYLVATRPTMADTALFPFIRQWAGVQEDNLRAFPHVQRWLNGYLESDRFKAIMAKQKPAT